MAATTRCDGSAGHMILCKAGKRALFHQLSCVALGFGSVCCLQGNCLFIHIAFLIAAYKCFAPG